MLAGASAVQLGTVHFYNPLAINEILQFLEEYCSQNNILSIGDIIGKAEV